ncbi:hypothetical protein D9M70_572780 [compost metagenome]
MEDVHRELLLLPPRQQRYRVALQVLAIDHEEERQQHHRQQRGEETRRGQQLAVGLVLRCGVHHLGLPAGLSAGGTGEVLRRLVGVLHRLGQFTQLGCELAHLARGLLCPFHRRRQHLVRQQSGRGHAAEQHDQCAQGAWHVDPAQHADDRVADQGEEQRQQEQQQHLLRGP